MSVPSDRRRVSLPVLLGGSSKTAHSGNRKRSSVTSSRSEPPLTDQVPGIHIQHIEALPYHVAIVTTDCAGGGDLICNEDRVPVAESNGKHRYIIIHNEQLSSTSSLCSRSSKASSFVNMNDFSSLESDTDPFTARTTARTTSTSAATGHRRRSTQQVKLLYFLISRSCIFFAVDRCDE